MPNGFVPNTDLIAGTKAYLKELDILAKITGQTRD
jgi:hypothetical protein